MRPNLPKKVFLVLLTLILLLFILHLTAFLTAYFGIIHYNDFFFQKVNFDEEKNLPSIFSSLLLLTASFLLAAIGTLKNKNRKFFWFTLSFLFLFLASDELLRIHEMAGRNLSRVLTTSGIFHYSWIIIYGIGVILLGILYLKPVMELQSETRRNFVISGAVFLSGAVGMEMFTGWLISYRELEDAQLIIRPEFFTLYTIEELLEMLGISYFIFSLLKYRKELTHQPAD